MSKISKFKIRFFKTSDAKQLSELDKIWQKEKVSPRMIPRTAKQFIANSKKEICFVAEADNLLVGYILGKPKNYIKNKKQRKYLYLESLYVLKQHRKLNIGKKLILAIIKESKNQNLDLITLDADSKARDKLISLYKKCGFSVSFTRMGLKLK